jgi:hypothetical protein
MTNPNEKQTQAAIKYWRGTEGKEVNQVWRIEEIDHLKSVIEEQTKVIKKMCERMDNLAEHIFQIEEDLYR